MKKRWSRLGLSNAWSTWYLMWPVLTSLQQMHKFSDVLPARDCFMAKISNLQCTYLPFKIPIQSRKEKSNLSFSNKDLHTLMYTLEGNEVKSQTRLRYSSTKNTNKIFMSFRLSKLFSNIKRNSESRDKITNLYELFQERSSLRRRTHVTQLSLKPVVKQ